jgi:hypothetical protein
MPFPIAGGNISKLAYEKAESAIQTADQANEKADSAFSYVAGVYLNPVNTLTDIATTYPNPSENDKVFVKDTGKYYLWNNVEWLNFAELTPEPYNTLASDLASIAMLPAKVEGSLDDTAQIQNAINTASTGNGLVKLQKGKTYIVGSLAPKPNVTIDLNGSTLKLKDATELPVFYDWGTAKPTKHKNFSVINGVIDANMQNNQAVNQSAGVFWLTDWDGLKFKDLKITNALRNIINLWGCHNSEAKNILCEGNGMVNANNYYSYGATFEPGCKNIVVDNFVVKTMRGFGIHFNQVEDYEAKNLSFDGLTLGGYAIAVTTTRSKRGKLTNISCKSVDGDNVEINACTDLEVSNTNIDGAGKRPILFGDDNSGIWNERVKLSNIKTTNTIGSESISVNWLKNGEISHAEFDKGLSTLSSVVSENVRFKDCIFNVSLPSLAIYYDKFKFINTKFNDVLVQRAENTIFEYGNIGKRLVMNDATTIEIPLANLAKESGMIGGKLQVISYMAGSTQGSYQEVGFVHYNTTLNITSFVSVDGSFARKVAVTADATNKKLILTNSTGQTLLVKWNLIGQ